MANLKTQSKQFEATKRIWMRDAQDTIRRVEESLHCMCPWKFNMMLHAWIWLKPEFPMIHYRMFSTWVFTRTRTPIITDKFDAKVKNLQYAVASAAKYVNVAKVRVKFEAHVYAYIYIYIYIYIYVMHISMYIYIFIFICLLTLSIIRNCHISRSVRHHGSKLSNWSFSSWLRDKKIDNHRKHRNRWWADFGRCGYQPNSRPGCMLQFLYVSSLCKMGAWGQSNVHSNVCTSHARTVSLLLGV